MAGTMTSHPGGEGCLVLGGRPPLAYGARAARRDAHGDLRCAIPVLREDLPAAGEEARRRRRQQAARRGGREELPRLCRKVVKAVQAGDMARDEAAGLLRRMGQPRRELLVFRPMGGLLAPIPLLSSATMPQDPSLFQMRQYLYNHPSGDKEVGGGREP